MKTSSPIKIDALSWTPLKRVVLSPAFPLVFQSAALVVVVTLAFLGFGLGSEMTDAELMTLRKTNLATLVVWGLWWPGMILVALALGRAWCTVCPMELVNRIGDAAARAFGWRRARLGMLLRAGWFIVVGYLVLQLLVAGLSIHRVPAYTTLLLLVLLAGALVSGLVFSEPRSFCRAFCPASALLSVYGRYTPFQLETRDPSVCDTCRTKDCVRAENRYKFDKRSCPSLLRPFTRQPSDGCVLCLQCVKVCPYGNMSAGIVSRGAGLRRATLLRPYEAAFVMVALGFVSHEVIGEVKWLDGLFHTIPAAMSTILPAVGFNWLEALWFLVLFPSAVWATIAFVAYAAGHRAGVRSLLLGAATGAAPMIAVAHLAKAAAKVSSWGGFLPLALNDPTGVSTLRQINSQALAAPESLIPLSVLGWLILALMMSVGGTSVQWLKQLRPGDRSAATIGMAGAAVLFVGILSVWSWPAP